MKKKKVHLEDLIIDLLERHPESRVSEEALMSAFKLPPEKGRQRFERALDKLSKKKIIERKKGEVKLDHSKNNGNVVEGIFSGTRHGSGYVKVEGRDQDIRIPAKYTHTALEKDRVRVTLLPKHRRDRMEGKVTDILERGKKYFVGTLHKQSKNNYLVIPDEKSAATEFFVHPDNVNGAGHNDKVTFRLVDWVHPRSLPEA